MFIRHQLEPMTPTRYPPYPDYRDSGVDWLGEIPAHWEVRRLKTVASVRPSGVDKHTTEGEVPVCLCNYTDVYYTDVITAELAFMEATATPDELQRFELRAGNVIITKDSESWDDIAVGAYVPSDLDGVICGYHLALIRPMNNEVYGRYLCRAFAAYPLLIQFKVAANGITRYGLSASAIGDSLFLLSPLSEQRTIADFLDRETARLDALIDAKRRLIECSRRSAPR